MYIFIGILFFLCLICFVLCHWRKRKCIRKVCRMNPCEKAVLLNELAEPFGFAYLSDQDIITSRVDAWQREFGYHAIYDQTAVRFKMVFDCEPIYFNYHNRTWMIELWKGQYGINAGAEIGIYRADSILTPDQYDKTLFHSIPDQELLPITMQVFLKGSCLFSIQHRHWWLTGFRAGWYCDPENMVIRTSITCCDSEMLSCLLKSLIACGYSECDIYIRDLTITFSYYQPHSRQPRTDCPLRTRFSRWENRICCRLYLRITRPFSCTLDRILYLYFFLPFAFRHMLHFKRNRHQKFHPKRRKKS